MKKSKIKKLTDKQLSKIVLYWYLKRTPDIWQNEDGHDLEEVLEQIVYS